MSLTREDFLRIAEAVAPGADPIEIEQAIYWWAADHHEGQWSELYSILSTSAYRPGPLESRPIPDSDAEAIYIAACDESACPKHEE